MCQRPAYSDSAVLILIKMNEQAEFGFIKTQSFKTLNRVLVANKVNKETRKVIEFNHKPAIEAYAEAVGAASADEAPKYFVTNPVGLVIGNNDFFIRSPRQKIGPRLNSIASCSKAWKCDSRVGKDARTTKTYYF